MSSLYSPIGWLSWAECVQVYEKAKKDATLMQGFRNTILGETYEQESETPEWQRLYETREDYPMGVVPRDGLFLTAGVDIQKNRIECEVVAWGRQKQSWSVDFTFWMVIPRSPRFGPNWPMWSIRTTRIKAGSQCRSE